MSFQEFQRRANRLSGRDIWFLIGLTIVTLLVLSVLVVINYNLARTLPGGGELTLLRVSGDYFLFQRIDPYSGSVPARVQEVIYGGIAPAGEDAYILDIPFHLMLVFLPLALIPDAVIARTVWLALSEVMMIGTIILMSRVLDRKLPFFLSFLILAFSIPTFYTYTALIEGSTAIWLSILFLGILMSMRVGFDELAGSLLLLSCFQWEVSLPFVVLVFMWIIWERRWRMLGGMGMLGFFLLAVSLFLYPNWLMPFLRAAWNSYRLGFGYSTHQVFRHLWPVIGGPLSWILTAGLIVVLGYEWSAARGKNFLRFIWVACLSIASAPMLGLPVEMDQLVLLMAPSVLILIFAFERWRRFGYGVAFLLLLLFTGVPWLIYYQGLPQGFSLSMNETLFIFLPLASVIGLYWVRWWVIRPPRTWLDSFAHLEKR